MVVEGCVNEVVLMVPNKMNPVIATTSGYAVTVMVLLTTVHVFGAQFAVNPNLFCNSRGVSMLVHCSPGYVGALLWTRSGALVSALF